MMGNELLRIADGFSMVADGIRGLAGMEWNGAADMAEKDAAVTGNTADGDTAVKTETESASTGTVQKAGKEDKKADTKKEKAVAIEDVRAVMAQKTQEGKSQEIKDLLQRYGAVKLSAVNPEHYPALLKEARVL